jgi:hypothetical protein
MTVSADPLVALRAIRLPPSEFDLGEQMLMAVALGVGIGALVAVLLRLTRHRIWQKGPEQTFFSELNAAKEKIADERLAAQAGALRRYIASIAGPAKSSLQGNSWLAGLDEVFGTDFFSAGKGRVFGEGLYDPHLTVEPSEIDQVFRKLVQERRQ